MNVFKNIVYFILSVQEKLLAKKLKKTLGVKSNSKRKKYFANGCLLSLDSIAETEKNKMEEELLLILKTSDYNIEKVLEYIKKHNTQVNYIENSKWFNYGTEYEGFVYPQVGLKALYLSLAVLGKFSLKTPEMFVISNKSINQYYFMYHFYNWYAFKHGIAGIDAETQALLNKYLYSASDDDIKSLQLTEIYKLKDAIKQDKSAIEFVFKLCRQQETSKKALEKIKDSGADL